MLRPGPDNYRREHKEILIIPSYPPTLPSLTEQSRPPTSQLLATKEDEDDDYESIQILEIS